MVIRSSISTGMHAIYKEHSGICNSNEMIKVCANLPEGRMAPEGMAQYRETTHAILINLLLSCTLVNKLPSKCDLIKVKSSHAVHQSCTFDFHTHAISSIHL